MLRYWAEASIDADVDITTAVLSAASATVEHVLILLHQCDSIHRDLDELVIGLHTNLIELGKTLRSERHARRDGDVADHGVLHLTILIKELGLLQEALTDVLRIGRRRLMIDLDIGCLACELGHTLIVVQLGSQDLRVASRHGLILHDEHAICLARLREHGTA